MAEPIIEVNNLSVIYNKDKSNEVRSLLDVSVKIYPQEYVIMYGPSGCGKSTLLYSISGLQLPTSGSVKIEGKDIATMKKKEIVQLHQTGIGMIFQAFYLISSLNILDNVCLPKVFRGDSRKDRKEEGMKLLRRFGLAEQSDKFSNQLSGGQQQRVSIARSLVNNPNIILADEPVGNLDSESAENVLKILKDLNEIDKKTIIMVTHNPEHLIYADRILHMKDGRIVEEEINKDKRPKEATQADMAANPETISDEIKLLMRTFKNFSPQQVGAMLVPFKAKQLIAHVLSDLTEEQITSAENFLKNLLFKNDTIDAFSKNLDLDFDEGGAGWNKMRAESFSQRIGKTLAQVEVLSAGDMNMAAKSVSEYMLSLFKIELPDEIKARMYAFIKLRLENKIDSAGLKQRLDAPVKLGGVGLYKPTVDKFAKEMEILMLLKYSA
ncbi:MAG: ABC transporter ATP-binding protein [Candidatus Moranbacteria bacterium]|nr:ABC transporter ATP-binding protein [Candidatus Moranbacteria bacterium]